MDTGDAGDAPGARRLVARVLLESSVPWLDQLFDYAVPESLIDRVKQGQRVRVPLRSKERKNFGWIVELTETSEFTGKLSNIEELIGEVPILQPEIWELARRVADRAAGSAGDILRLAIPNRYVRAEKKYLAEVNVAVGDKPSMIDATGLGSESLDSEAVTGKSTVENQSVQVVEPGSGAPIAIQQMSDADDKNQEDYAEKIARLLTSGEKLSYLESYSPVRLETGQWVSRWAKTIARIAVETLKLGKSTIVCVPDYRDIAQLQGALESLNAEFIRCDAKQPAADRYMGFLKSLEQKPRIIIGNRSAVYAPAYNLGAVLIWDDGDSLFNEPLAPYVHCRDAALMRAKLQGHGLMFMSHTRSLEIQRLVDIGFVRSQQNYPRRVRTVHAGQAATPDEFAGRLPGFAIQMIRQGLQTGPVLVQVARAGFAPWAVCGDCQSRAECAKCAGPLGFAHSHPGCRICGDRAANWKCRFCGSMQLRKRGAGSRLTAEHFGQQFPGVRVIVSDGESPHTFVDSRPVIVISTPGAEPIAAGGYRAVILLDAYSMLSVPTLRAEENTLRWWHNAASLAAADGLCVLASGSGAVVEAFVSGKDDAWSRVQLGERAELRFPPAVRTASVTGGGAQIEVAQQEIEDIQPHDVLGPVPVGDGVFRMIVRFPYNVGESMAKHLRGAILKQAAGSMGHSKGNFAVRKAQALRVKFDDGGVFDDFVLEE